MTMPIPPADAAPAGHAAVSPPAVRSTPGAAVQQRFELASLSVGFGSWELDLDSGENRWDAQMWRLRGREHEAGLVSIAQRRNCLHPDDRWRAEQLLDRSTRQAATFEYQFRIVRPDGGIRWLSSRSVEHHDLQHGTRYRIGVNWDITDIHNAEAARQQAAIVEAELLAKSQFMARMSHELRTPLNAVLGFAELLLSRETALDPESALRSSQLSHIQMAGRQLLGLVDDVLDLSRVEGGDAQIEMVPVSLADVLAEVLPLLEPMRVSADVSVDVALRAGPVWADAHRLRQVLLNLLRNAIHFNRPGGRVRIEWLERGDRGAERLLRISDTGRGMSEEQVLHLFQPFNRATRQRDDNQGSGIGLAIVKALIERMDGTVHVHSREGEGSVFELRLSGVEAHAAGSGLLQQAALHPVPDGDAERAVATSLQQRTNDAATALNTAPTESEAGAALHDVGRSRAPHQLLYIEDNPVNALIISELLGRRDDLRLAIAVDGSSGVAEARRLQPTLILLDMQLPDFDGFEVLRRLRADPVTSRIPCVALSANAMPEDIQRAMRAGMSDYWTKPLDFKRFLVSLDAMLGLAA